ncbi:MAG: DNA translocase FtsK [Solobacterium sp.]|nr:DNA translocase FtsK [Solobacterium sp.]MCH4222231.1 DNA translocase FtsK [Solobacterium sp.]MCH4265751.1 DNA translocase FtsK [Solobacterium sp.]
MSKKKNSRSTKRISKKEQEREAELKRWIMIVIIAAITLIAYMNAGVVGKFLNSLQRFLFGRMYLIIMVILMVQIFIVIVNGRTGVTSDKNPTAIVLIILAVLLTFAYLDTDTSLRGFDVLKNYVADIASYFNGTAGSKIGGGVIGAFLYSLSTILLDRTGTVLIIVVLFVIAALLLVNLDVYKHAFSAIATYFSTVDEEDDDEEEEEEEEIPEDEEEEPLSIPEADDEPEQEEQQPVIHPEPVIRSKNVGSVRMIDADETDMTKEDAPEVPPVSASRSQYDILADQHADPALENTVPLSIPTEEPHVSIPETSKEPQSIFIKVDDLVDQVPETDETETEEDPLQKEALPEDEDDEVIEGQPAEETEEIPALDEDSEAEPAPVKVKPAGGIETARRRSNKPYRLPPITLLDPIPPKAKDDPNIEAAQEKGELLIEVLRNFEIEAHLIDTHIGPAVTKFEIRPDANVKVSKILNLTDDIKMQLAVRDIRIEAPIPGHNAVGIEIPNVQATPVKMKDCITKIPEKEKSQQLVFILGKDLLGNVITCRLDKMPHLLIAGATGSGKSVCMNTIITSLLLRTKPDDVKMLLVDPKKVEFTPYQKIPHLIGPVINDAAQASNALKAIVKIMEDRYSVFSKCGVRNIQVYNDKVKDGTINIGLTDAQPKYEKMPYIVVIIDELADLMVVAGKEVESSIQRITQLARAAGIHLIVATQRPSTDVITGIIKANIPSRIAFSVSSGIDSRTILDHVGAERLLGNGDMLYMPIGQSASTRIQGVFVTDSEVQRISDFVSKEAVPMYDDSFVRLEGVEGNDGTAVASEDADPLYEEVKEFVIDQQKASTSLLQRRFGIGYNRSARMIDLLESKGIIGPAQGSKPRDVYIKKDRDGNLDEE